MNSVRSDRWSLEWIDPDGTVHGYRCGSEDMIRRWATHMEQEMGYSVTVTGPTNEDDNGGTGIVGR